MFIRQTKVTLPLIHVLCDVFVHQFFDFGGPSFAEEFPHIQRLERLAGLRLDIFLLGSFEFVLLKNPLSSPFADTAENSLRNVIHGGFGGQVVFDIAGDVLERNRGWPIFRQGFLLW